MSTLDTRTAPHGTATDDGLVARRPRVIVADIDGTCAHRGDRSPYDESRVGEDTPDDAVRFLLRAAASTGECRVVYLSGRTQRSRRATSAWLALHGFPTGDLWMRRDGDRRPDTVVKRELYRRHLAGEDVIAVVDDRPSVCRMWRSLGLTVLQVGDPHVEF